MPARAATASDAERRHRIPDPHHAAQAGEVFIHPTPEGKPVTGPLSASRPSKEVISLPARRRRPRGSSAATSLPSCGDGEPHGQTTHRRRAPPAIRDLTEQEAIEQADNIWLKLRASIQIGTSQHPRRQASSLDQDEALANPTSCCQGVKHGSKTMIRIHHARLIIAVHQDHRRRARSGPPKPYGHTSPGLDEGSGE